MTTATPGRAVVFALVLVVGLAADAGRAAAADGLWNAVAAAPLEAAAHERRQAVIEAQVALDLAATPPPSPSAPGSGGAVGAGRGGDAKKRAALLALAEARLRRAIEIVPHDFEGRWQLAELLSSTGRPADAVRALLAALRTHPTAEDEARLWFRVAGERSRLGDYAGGVDAIARMGAAIDDDPAALANQAELLMALGRLDEAVDRYQEALALEERAPDRRSRLSALALGYLGLAVAQDRRGRDVASREAMGRALALDPGLGTLRAAEPRGAGDAGDLFLVPPGDVFYYLGLARIAQGRPRDAEGAFRNYLRVTSGPYGPQARAHIERLSRLAGAPSPPAQRRAPGPAAEVRYRLAGAATLSVDGPLVAPLIDAAWRLQRGLVEPCLAQHGGVDAAADAGSEGGRSEWRLRLDLEFDGQGRVSQAAATAPAGVDPRLGACIADAVRASFHVTRPAHRKASRVRMDLVLAKVEPSEL